METLWVIESGSKRKAEKHDCEFCGTEFLRRICKKAKKYCSIECRTIKRKIKLNCFNCGKEIFRAPSKLKNSIHGYHFCNRKCKEEAQSLKGNCSAIRPSHYGTSNGREVYKNLIKNSSNPICVGCGESKKYLLNVHHIDGNKKNNIKENLEITCSNCHIKRHLRKNADDNWSYWTQVLTPRDQLLKL